MANVIYTKSAKISLNNLFDNLKNKIEDELQKKKYIFGDDSVEITSNDIKEIQERLVFSNKRNKKKILKVMGLSYLVIGLVTLIIGIGYPFWLTIIRNNPFQLTLLLSGFVLTIFSLLILVFYRMREEKESSVERNFIKEFTQTDTSINKYKKYPGSITLDGIDKLLYDYLIEDIPSDLDCLSTHTTIGDVSDISFSSVEISEGGINISGNGLIEVELQYGSDGDIRREEGMAGSKEFPFIFNIIISTDLKQIIEVNDMSFDTRSFYN